MSQPRLKKERLRLPLAGHRGPALAGRGKAGSLPAQPLSLSDAKLSKPRLLHPSIHSLMLLVLPPPRRWLRLLLSVKLSELLWSGTRTSRRTRSGLISKVLICVLRAGCLLLLGAILVINWPNRFYGSQDGDRGCLLFTEGSCLVCPFAHCVPFIYHTIPSSPISTILIAISRKFVYIFLHPLAPSPYLLSLLLLQDISYTLIPYPHIM